MVFQRGGLVSCYRPMHKTDEVCGLWVQARLSTRGPQQIGGVPECPEKLLTIETSLQMPGGDGVPCCDLVHHLQIAIRLLMPPPELRGLWVQIAIAPPVAIERQKVRELRLPECIEVREASTTDAQG
jgi:hypothetical protein